MRKHGTLIKWNDKRGFGFISTEDSDTEIFVHISAFPNDGRRPALNESLSFEIETGNDGKKRAVRVQRPGYKGWERKAHRKTGGPRKVSAITVLVIVILLIGAISWFMNSSIRFDSYKIDPYSAKYPVVLDGRFQCDGRTMCSEMTSCEEARYFHQYCVGSKMDGDGDGIPCERQWC